MSKLILSEVPNGVSNTVTNTNFDKIENELNNNVLKRRTEVGEDNAVHTDIDMNSNRIYNLPKPVKDHEPLRLAEMGEIKGYTEESKDWAEKSQGAYENTLEALTEGSEYIGNYGPGLVIEAYTDFFGREGIWWRPTPDLELPYTATGNWGSEEELFVEVGVATLRKDLANPQKGALMVRGAVIYVDTIADLQAVDTSALVDGRQVSVNEFYDGSSSGAGIFVWKSGTLKSKHDGVLFVSPTVPWNGSEPGISDFLNGVGETDTGGSGVFVRISGQVTHDCEVSVGTGGDFLALQDALAFLSSFTGTGSSKATITLLSGYRQEKQLYFNSCDLSWITVTSEDAEVQFARENITEQLIEGDGAVYPAIAAENARLPRMDVLWEIDATGIASARIFGYQLRNSVLVVGEGKGMRYAPARNLEASWGSIVSARGGDFSGAGQRGNDGSTNAYGQIGIRASNSAIVYARGAVCNDCHIGISCSQAWVDATSATINNNIAHGISCNSGGIVTINNANIDGNATGASTGANISIFSTGFVMGYGASAKNSGNHGLRVSGARADLPDLNVSGSVKALDIGEGADISVNNLIADNCGTGIDVYSSSNVRGRFMSIKGVGSSGYVIRASHGSKVIANDVNATLSTSTNYGLVASGGAEIVADSGDLSGWSGRAIFAYRSGKIVFSNGVATGAGASAQEVVSLEDGSELLANGANFSNRQCVVGLRAIRGCRADISNTDLSIGGATNGNDISLNSGCWVSAHGSQGGFVEAPNTITSRGIFLK